MKLVHPDFFFPIEFRENYMETIVVESPRILSQCLEELRRQIDGIGEGQWVLSEQAEALDIKKACCLLMDPFSVDLNNKRMLAGLYAAIEKGIISTELLQVWNRTYPELLGIMEKLVGAVDYELVFTDDIAIKDFLKFMSVRYEDANNNFFERLLDYMRLAHDVLKTRLFILVNGKTFLTMEQLRFLYKQSCYEKYQLLLFEARDSIESRLEGERVTIIDQDACVIR